MTRKRDWLNFWVPMGIGVAVCGATLKWPDHGTAFMAVGAIIIAASLAYLRLTFLPSMLLGICAGLAIFGFDALTPSWRDEKLPGFSLVSVISIQDARKYNDKYVFRFSDQEGAVVSFYLSAGDVFHFSIKDIRGETKDVDIPSGHDGIPLFKPISLLLEAGTASNYSVMRVSVNGRMVKEERFPFHLELGSRKWAVGSIGALPDGSAGASFTTTEIGLPSATLDHGEAVKLDENMRNYWGIKR